MTKKVLKIHDLDNVAVALIDLEAGDKMALDGIEITATEHIRRGHKVAIEKIFEGANVTKYGHPIGHATSQILPGQWVHSHNLETNLKGTVEYEYRPVQIPITEGYSKSAHVFQGFRRSDGKVGTRNEIWIINTVGCVNTSAKRIAEIANSKFTHKNFDGVRTFPHQFGCSQLGDDLENTQKILSGLMKNPNAGGVLLLGLGCENNQLDSLLKVARGVDEWRLRTLVAQSVTDEVEEGLKKVGELFEILKDDIREEFPISELVVGMKCGGSDAFSGVTANPLLGRVSDMLTAMGGKVILTEVPEMFGAEQLLMNRAKDEGVFRKIVEMINYFKGYFIEHGQPIYENPSPGNKEGGLTTLEEKSLGAVQKGGRAIVTDVLPYGGQVNSSGLTLLAAPGNDGISSTAMVAAGATLLLFTTGRGTPLGFPVPTVKVSSNSYIYEKKRSWIDFDAGKLLEGEVNIDQLADEFLNFIIDVASGNRRTMNEINDYREIAIWKEGVTL